ncbi:MAG: esterase-like activity of phytase family protein [Geminicoccaceae bacterium]
MIRLAASLIASCLLLLATAACAYQPPRARPELRATPIAAPDTRLGDTRLGEARLEGAWELRSSVREFGGISAAELRGDRLWLLSDRSHLFELPWSWPAAGQPFVLPVLARDELRLRDGSALDAEAMLPWSGGGHLVADEGSGRLWPFALHGVRPAGPALLVPLSPGTGGNLGVEALARLPDGSLLALVEGEAADGLHDAFRLAGDGEVVRWRYRAAAGFSPTDAAVAGDFLFVLERRVSLLGGWQARLVAIPLARLPQGEVGVLDGHEIVRVTGPELGENYEGLAVVADAGGYRLLLVSDDNFSFLQRTRLLLLRWQPAQPALAGLATGGT